ncbi:MAG: universal stress protein [Solirubrobacteraceae bacterium]
MPTTTRTSTVARIAVGIDGYPEGRDAAVLATAIARATGAELLLVAVHPDPLVVLPRGLTWTGLHEQAVATLREVRDSLAADARIAVETDFSIPRALGRVVRRDHRDLLVMGSSRHAPDRHVRIGKRTRQLLCHFESALAVAPRGMHAGSEPKLGRIGVGYDGRPESQAALRLAHEIAAGAGAELHICGVVDDRIRGAGEFGADAAPGVLPGLGWSSVGAANAQFDERVSAAEQRLRDELEHAASVTGETVTSEVVRGRPADRLLELAADVDLLVIGSRRWGPVARLMLGSTGEALLHDAPCAVVVVPRAHD